MRSRTAASWGCAHGASALTLASLTVLQFAGGKYGIHVAGTRVQVIIGARYAITGDRGAANSLIHAGLLLDVPTRKGDAGSFDFNGSRYKKCLIDRYCTRFIFHGVDSDEEAFKALKFGSEVVRVGPAHISMVPISEMVKVMNERLTQKLRFPSKEKFKSMVLGCDAERLAPNPEFTNCIDTALTLFAAAGGNPGEVVAHIRTALMKNAEANLTRVREAQMRHEGRRAAMARLKALDGAMRLAFHEQRALVEFVADATNAATVALFVQLAAVAERIEGLARELSAAALAAGRDFAPLVESAEDLLSNLRPSPSQEPPAHVSGGAGGAGEPTTAWSYVDYVDHDGRDHRERRAREVPEVHAVHAVYEVHAMGAVGAVDAGHAGHAVDAVDAAHAGHAGHAEREVLAREGREPDALEDADEFVDSRGVTVRFVT